MLPIPLLRSIVAVFNASQTILCHDHQLAQEDSLMRDIVGLGSQESFFFSAAQDESKIIARLNAQDLRFRTLLVDCSLGNIGSQGQGILNSNYVWAVAEGAANLEALPLRLDSNYLIYRCEEDGACLLTEIYKVKGDSLRKKPFGRWSLNGGLVMSEKEVWERRSDLMGTILLDTTLPWTTWNIVISESDPLTGMVPDILHTLASTLNFTVEWKHPEDGSYGSQNENGTWSGIIGELVDGVGDVSTGGLLFTSNRKRAIDFSMVLIEETVRLHHLSSYGQSVSILNFVLFLKIFSAGTWLTIITAILVIMSISYFEDKTSFGLQETSSGPTLLSIWFPVDGNICNSHMRNKTTKILFLSATFMTYILYVSYCSDLVAYMTVGKSTSMRYCSDMKESGFKLFSGEGTFLEEILAVERFKECQEIRATLDPNCQVQCAVEALEKEPTIAFFFGPELIDARLSSVASFPSPSVPSGLVYRKDSEFAALFDHHLLKMIQSGVLRRIYDRWIGSFKDMYNSRGDAATTINPVPFDQLYFPAAVMAIGILAGVVLGSLERLHENNIAKIRRLKN